MRAAIAIAITLGTSLPALAEPTTLQVDAIAGDAHMMGARADSWADGTRVRLGGGARRGAWAAMLRVGIMSLAPSAANFEDSHLTSVATSLNVEWYPLPGRWEPFVSLGVHDDRTVGTEQFPSNPTERSPMRVDPTGRGLSVGAGIQVTTRSDAHLAAARFEIAYTDGGTLFLGLGGELGANVSR